MSGQAGGPLGEDDAEIAGVAFEEADQDGGSLGSEPLWVRRDGSRRFDEADLGDDLAGGFFEGPFVVVVVVEWRRRRLVEAELVG